MFFKWHNKLVRDKVPQLIEERGCKMLFKKLSPTAHKNALFTKLVEEAKEVGRTTDRQSLIVELADLTEVMEAIRVAHNIPEQEVTWARRIKAVKSGIFFHGYHLYCVLGPGKVAK